MSTNFDTLGLHPDLLRAIVELGYETPTPIQSAAIPVLLEGRDMLGQAQTGTGKTAAFALPMLQTLDFSRNRVQGLVLTPTRELAVQVSEAIYSYGKHLGVKVLPIYGGKSYTRQFKKLTDGVHVVVGTPGRTLDLINQGALDLRAVRFVVLDEADEMLSMGFIEDVETILGATSTDNRLTALFSATLPDSIRKLADRYMREPQIVAIAQKTMTVPQTEQRYYLLTEDSKLPALARLLEVEEIASALVFTRTKIGAANLAEALQARNFAAEAIHGDLTQDAREIVLRRFRSGKLRVLVATDVVARGMDIQGVSHVVNYDIPGDAEDYVHRIGRTGRAGNEGIAITLVTPRERRWLKTIESFTRQPIPRVTLPAPADVQAKRDERFAVMLSSTLGETDLEAEINYVTQLAEAGYEVTALAAAAIRLLRAAEAARPIEDVRELAERDERRPRRESDFAPERRGKTRRAPGEHEAGMVRLSLNVGREHGIRPGDIVGAIASKADIPGNAIGAIDILQHETLVDVKESHIERVLRLATRLKLRGQNVQLRRATSGDERPKHRKSGDGAKFRKTPSRDLLEI